MSIGSGIALAGWFIAFVWACTVSENVAAGIVISGIVAAGTRGIIKMLYPWP
jgi:hypothetical protein